MQAKTGGVAEIIPVAERLLQLAVFSKRTHTSTSARLKNVRTKPKAAAAATAVQ